MIGKKISSYVAAFVFGAAVLAQAQNVPAKQMDNSEKSRQSSGKQWKKEFRQRPLEINILHMNDHHSHLTSETLDIDVSEMGLRTTLSHGSALEEVTVEYGGFPMLVNVFKQTERRVKNPLKIHAGDAITGTLYYSLFKGEADAAMMNHICFDAFALGNHEFDDGDSGLAYFLDYLNSDENGCQTSVLAANVVPADDSAIASGYIKPYVIFEIEGQDVGVIGIDIAGKTKNSSSPDSGTEFLDETETAQYYVDELTDQGVDKIILVTHYQYSNDLELAQKLTGVDVIVGGDSHTLLGDDTLTDLGFTVQGDYPTEVTNLDGNKVCVVQAWEYAHLMGRLSVKFDRNGDVQRCSGSPIIPFSREIVYTDNDADETEKTLYGRDARDFRRTLWKSREITFVSPDAETEELLAGFDEDVDELTQTIIGGVSENLCLERIPGQGRSTICEVEDTYEYGSDISNVVAKAFLSVTPTADIAIQNGGGVRVDVAAGDYTIADAYTLLPFSNTLVTLEMTGQQIIDVLEDAVDFALFGDSTGAYPYASCLRYDVDGSQVKGGRISNVEVNPRLSGDWAAIDTSATYTVVTNDYIASGKDGYTTFGEVFNAGDYVDTYTEYAQGFIDYVDALTLESLSVEKLPIDEYSTQHFIDPDGCDHSVSTNCSYSY